MQTAQRLEMFVGRINVPGFDCDQLNIGCATPQSHEDPAAYSDQDQTLIVFAATNCISDPCISTALHITTAKPQSPALAIETQSPHGETGWHKRVHTSLP